MRQSWRPSGGRRRCTPPSGARSVARDTSRSCQAQVDWSADQTAPGTVLTGSVSLPGSVGL